LVVLTVWWKAVPLAPVWVVRSGDCWASCSAELTVRRRAGSTDYRSAESSVYYSAHSKVY